jgi:hypothetical protein
MNLSPKAIRFLVEALEFQMSAYQTRLDSEELDEDDVADLTNDLMFLESLLQELKKMQATPIARVF